MAGSRNKGSAFLREVGKLFEWQRMVAGTVSKGSPSTRPFHSNIPYALTGCTDIGWARRAMAQGSNTGQRSGLEPSAINLLLWGPSG